MLDVFTEEIEIQIKQGMANLYWYQNDLKKSWMSAGVPFQICNQLFGRKTIDGRKMSKRELMDVLYEKTRELPYNKRLEISRNFVRFLIENKDFSPQNPKHRIDIAERYALKLKAIYQIQKEKSKFDSVRNNIRVKERQQILSLDSIRIRFENAKKLTPQKRGYELENIFTDLMRINNISVEKPFKIEGEQIDGSIKYDSHYYLVECKWVDKKIAQGDISSLYMKVEGKFEARGIMISMSGYSKEVLNSLPRGKEIKIILLDGVHLANVIYGNYTFRDLLDYAIKQATLRSDIYCSHSL